MIKKLLLFYFLFQGVFSYAETIKTDVLVIGGSASGVAAAIQSSRSKLKTVLIEQGPWLGGSMTSGGICVLDGNRDFQSGIWAEFRQHIINFYKKVPGYDSTRNAVLRFEPYTGAAILKKITDTVKNLSVKLNTPLYSLKQDGDGWEAEIMVNNEKVTIKARVLIDATQTAEAATLAGVKFVADSIDRAESTTVLPISFAAVVKDNGRAADRTIKKPVGYNPQLYSCIKGADIKALLKQSHIVNDKYLVNWCANQYNVTIQDLEPENRAATYHKARLHTLGLIYYLQTVLGYKNLSIEGFDTPDHLPYQPFVRQYKQVNGLLRMVADDVYNPYGRASNLYRTGIAPADALPAKLYNDNQTPFPAYSIPLGAVVVSGAENMLVTENAMSVTPQINAGVVNPAVQMTLGQGVGATAAFLAFFKTTTKNLHVRIIQGEILDFKGYILPVSDIDVADPYWRSVQQVCATGLLETVQQAEGDHAKIIFQPDSAVYTAQIKPVLTELYTRAFLWFNQAKPGTLFTTGNLLSFISQITLADPDPFQSRIQKAWKSEYNFTSEFSLDKPLTRYEFAVLANKFLNPFARRVDITGKVVN